MQAAEAHKSSRKPTKLSLDSALVEDAKALGIDESRCAEAGIAEAVRLHKQEKWLKENAEALPSSNSHVEANGLPLARHRQLMKTISEGPFFKRTVAFLFVQDLNSLEVPAAAPRSCASSSSIRNLEGVRKTHQIPAHSVNRDLKCYEVTWRS